MEIEVRSYLPQHTWPHLSLQSLHGEFMIVGEHLAQMQHSDFVWELTTCRYTHVRLCQMELDSTFLLFPFSL